jgi:histidine triad (HIT) family protein
VSETKECLFCRIISGGIPARIAWQSDALVAFHDINPQAPLHVLICPRKHIASLNDMVPGDESLIGEAIGAAARIARETGHAEDGYRVVLNCGAGAGQSVFHIHVHLLAGRPFGWPPG